MLTNCHLDRVRQRLSVAAESNGYPDSGRVVILGGTGRVGSSTAVALIKKCPGLEVVVASRSRDSFQKAQKKRPLLSKAKYEQVLLSSRSRSPLDPQRHAPTSLKYGPWACFTRQASRGDLSRPFANLEVDLLPIFNNCIALGL